MSNFRAFICVVVLLAPVRALSAQASEQGVPYREGNIWNGMDHEPVPFQVHRDEQAAGIAASSGQQKEADDTVEQLYRELLQTQRRHVQ